jgi:hypothetical protein
MKNYRYILYLLLSLLVMTGCSKDDGSDDGSGDSKPIAAKSRGEKLRHCGGIKVLRHDSRASPQNLPRKKGTQKGIPNSNPCGGNAVFPSELPRIAYKYDSGKVGCAVGKGRDPRSNASPAQKKAVNVCGVLLVQKSND